MRHLYIGPDRVVVQMESVYDFQPGRDCACHAWLDSHRRASGHAPAIRRSIWPDLLYSLGPATGHTCIPKQFCLCLYGEVGRVGVWLELLFCPSHVVVDHPHYALIARAQVPRHRIEVAICASGNF